MNPPPPRLPASGQVTASVSATATAASTALPPRFMTSAPTCEAIASTEATIACGSRTGRRDAAWRGATKRRSAASFFMAGEEYRGPRSAARGPRLAAIVRVQRHVVVAEIGGPHHDAAIPAAEVEGQRDALASEDARCILLAIFGRAAVPDECPATGGQRDSLDGESRAAATDRRKNASPVRIAAVQSALHQR